MLRIPRSFGDHPATCSYARVRQWEFYSPNALSEQYQPGDNITIKFASEADVVGADPNYWPTTPFSARFVGNSSGAHDDVNIMIFGRIVP